MSPAVDILSTMRALAAAGSSPTHWFVAPRDYIGIVVASFDGTERDVINGFERIHYLERWYARHGLEPVWPNSWEGLWSPPRVLR